MEEQKYLNLLRTVLETGEEREDRTGVGTLSLFGAQMRFDLQKGFPLLTTKKVHLRSIIHELLWFISGDTNIRYLKENKVSIWDEWADESGNLGPVYGYQWRNWRTPDGRTVDQIANLMESLQKNKNSRRHIVTAWNPSDVDEMALPPCHTLFQFYVHQDNRLSCQLYQRSADFFLGVPFNIASYSLFVMMIAKVLGYELGYFVHSFGDLHLYKNHIEQAKLQLERSPKPAPKMIVKRVPETIFDYKYEDFELVGYDPHERIAAPIAV